ncbi:hypothetical protein [Sphingomonas oryzagri]
MDYFASAAVKRVAREEAIHAIRIEGSHAADYLLGRMAKARGFQRRQVYRIAASLVSSIREEG